MGNFDFVRQTLPSRACRLRPGRVLPVVSDPRSACFYSRRAVEELVGYLYDVLALPVPVPGRPGGADQRRRVQGQGRRRASRRSST